MIVPLWYTLPELGKHGLLAGHDFLERKIKKNIPTQNYHILGPLEQITYNYIKHRRSKFDTWTMWRSDCVTPGFSAKPAAQFCPCCQWCHIKEALLAFLVHGCNLCKVQKSNLEPSLTNKANHKITTRNNDQWLHFTKRTHYWRKIYKQQIKSNARKRCREQTGTKAMA